MKRILTLLVWVLASASMAMGQNPYLPLWEYIPDGEPHVFEDPDNPGQYRIYIYGSHDVLGYTYCGRDQVVWSAPVENPREWRYDGVIFTSEKDANGEDLNEGGLGDVLYAPDIVMKKDVDGNKKYYFYPNTQSGERHSMVAVSDRPDGPFTVCNWDPENPRRTVGIFGFDPAVYVDDDGRVYGYWGFEDSNGCELDPENMADVKPGTEIVRNMVSSSKQEGVFRFFEASSMRKVGNKYVLVYSRVTADGEFGLPAVNYTLAYAYSDSPLGPFTYGGTLIDARARGVDKDGNTICTANPYGNTHGSIEKIGKKWWLFYHRQTGTDEYSRQTMVAPVKVKAQRRKGGKVTISEAEYTSEGFRTEGLDPLAYTDAAYACYYTNPDGIAQQYPHFIFTGSYIESARKDGLCEPEGYPVINNTDGSVVGYKYFNFRSYRRRCRKGAASIMLRALPEGVDGTITILVGDKVVGSLELSKDEEQAIAEYSIPLQGMKNARGKQPVYFQFTSSEHGKSICKLYGFQFRID